MPQTTILLSSPTLTSREVAVQLVHGAPPPSDIPHEHAGVVAAGVQPVLDPVPGEALDTSAVTLRDTIVNIKNRYI